MKNVFVGNLTFGATEETLRFMFENHGTVERVSIVTDRETGRSRGFGFVALNGSELGGRAVTVNEARPKDRSFSAGAFGANTGGYRGNRERDHGRVSRW